LLGCTAQKDFHFKCEAFTEYLKILSNEVIGAKGFVSPQAQVFKFGLCQALYFAAAGDSLPRVFFCLLTKETKTAGARLLGDLLVFDG